MKTENNDKIKENVENESFEENAVEYTDSSDETPIILDEEYYRENRDIVQYSNLFINRLDDGEEVVVAMRYHYGFPSDEELERYVPYWEAVQRAYGKRVMPIFVGPQIVEED